MLKPPRHGGNLAWAASLVGCPTSSLLDFSASLNPLGPPLWVNHELQTGLSSLTAYPNPDYGDLRTALGQWHHLPPDWILPSNGVAELLTWVAWELSQLSITYCLTPAFGDYQRAFKTFNLKVESCPLVYSEESLICTGENLPKVVKNAGILLNNPHNPTGKQFTDDQLLEYLNKFQLVVVDEAFMDFLPPQHQSSLIDKVQNYPNLVILRSLTKFYTVPGLRLGYGISHPQRLQKWQALRDPWTINSLADKIGQKIPQDQEFQRQTWDWLQPTKESFYQALGKISGLTPYRSVANFLLVKSEISSLVLQEKLLKDYQILIRDCVSFPELGDRFFRVAVKMAEDNQRLLEALKRL